MDGWMSRSSVPIEDARGHTTSPDRSVRSVRSGRSGGRAPSGHDPLGNFRVVIRRRMGQNTRVFIFILYTHIDDVKCASSRWRIDSRTEPNRTE